MSYAGTVLDMIKRMKHNESQRKALIDHRRQWRESYLDFGKNAKDQPKDLEISKDELDKIKLEIRTQIRKEKKIARIKFFVISLVVTFIYVYLTYIFVFPLISKP